MRVSFTRGRPAGSPQRALVAVDRLPAGVGDELGLALGAAAPRRRGIRRRALARAGGAPAPLLGREVGEHRVDGLLRVLLVGADHARGAALDPADHVLAGSDRARRRRRGRGRRRWGSSPSARRRGRPAAGCRDSRSRGTTRPAASVSCSSVGAPRAGRRRARRRARCGPARRRRARPSVVGEERDRREQEAQHDALAMPLAEAASRSRAGSRRCAAQVDVRSALGIVRRRAPARAPPASTITSASASSPSSSSSGFVKAACAGSAPADDRRPRGRWLAREHLERVVGGVGRRQLLGRQHEHARDVERDVAVADHHRALGREQVDLQVACGRGGRCTSRRTPSRHASRAALRPGCRAAGPTASRSRRRSRGSGASSSSRETCSPKVTLPK